MGFLDWWRKRATTDPTGVGLAAAPIALAASPATVPSAEEQRRLGDAAAAYPELQCVYVFRDERDGADALAVGLVLDEALGEERLQEIVLDLGSHVSPEHWGGGRVVVEPLGADLLRSVAAVGVLVYER